ncbi:MAG TPA: DUF3619 family protein [Rhodocyclaceae bacterium]
MNQDDKFPDLIRKNLDRGLLELPPDTVRRLDDARHRALASRNSAAGQVALAGNLELTLGLWAFRPRVFGFLSVALLVLATLAFLHGQRHIHQIEELDSAILTDDLPLEAYLDKDFDQWLRRGTRY